jgi:hypothetical protein
LGVFDGASQQNLWGGGGILYLSLSHYFIMTIGIGPRTNNFVELLSLKLLIVFTIEKRLSKFQSLWGFIKCHKLDKRHTNMFKYKTCYIGGRHTTFANKF